MKRSFVIGACLNALTVPAFAQEAPAVRRQELTRVELERQSMTPSRAPGIVESRITTGRPYSAEAST